MFQRFSFFVSLALTGLFLPTAAMAQTAPAGPSHSLPAPSKEKASPPEASIALKVPEKSVMQMIANQPEFSKFNAAVKIANLDTLLSYASPLTVFVPTNDAFAKLTPQEIYNLYDPRNLVQLQAMIKSHIVLQTLDPSSFHHLAVKSFQGTMLHINLSPTGLLINEKVKVSLPPLIGSNGIIYMIDHVLFPALP